MANGKRASMLANICGKDYYNKRRGVKLNMHPVSCKPGKNKWFKRYTHKRERVFDKLLIVKELIGQ
jgi:hypothetical protein